MLSQQECLLVTSHADKGKWNSFYKNFVFRKQQFYHIHDQSFLSYHFAIKNQGNKFGLEFFVSEIIVASVADLKKLFFLRFPIFDV